MSTDVVQVPYEDSESGEQVTGTLRFHNTSGTVSWQPAGWTQPKAHHFSGEEALAFAAAVILGRAQRDRQWRTPADFTLVDMVRRELNEMRQKQFERILQP